VQGYIQTLTFFQISAKKNLQVSTYYPSWCVPNFNQTFQICARLPILREVEDPKTDKQWRNEITIQSVAVYNCEAF